MLLDAQMQTPYGSVKLLAPEARAHMTGRMLPLEVIFLQNVDRPLIRLLLSPNRKSRQASFVKVMKVLAALMPLQFLEI